MQEEPHLPYEVGEICADRYRIERVLGCGGMGVVYRAVHCFTQGRVALKVLYEPVSDLAERMGQEARLLAAIQHRHVVRVLDGGATPTGVVWFAMELLEGRSLRDRLHGTGRLPLPTAAKYALQIAQGVGAAHRAGVVHRDLKPENVFVVEPEDEIRVLDFGTAKFRRGSLKTTNRMRVLGTYAYMAPERLQGHPGDPRSDVYSLGHVAYELLTGRHAFADGPGPLDLPPAFELGMRQMLGRPRPLERYRPDVPRALAALTLRMLEKHPDDRPADMEEVIAELEATSEGWSSAVTAHGGYSRRPPDRFGEALLGNRPALDSGVIRTSPTPLPLGPHGTVDLELMTPDRAGTLARGARRPTHRDWLQHLRPGEYPGCRTFEAQAILGAVRFASRGKAGRNVERDLAAVMSSDGEPDQVHLVENAAIAMLVLSGPDRTEVRHRIRDWAAALDPARASEARSRLAALVERAHAASPGSFVEDALRATRVVTGASTFPTRNERDPKASNALFTLANGSLEDIQLAHFGLLLLTRVDLERQRKVRAALEHLASGSESARDAARAELGPLLAESVRPQGLERAGSPPRLHSEPVTRRQRKTPDQPISRVARDPPRQPFESDPAFEPPSPGQSSVEDEGPLDLPFWGRRVQTRWVPLILAGALFLGALLTMAVMGVPRPGESPSVSQSAPNGGEVEP
ncbi:MAG: serine/threonine protein kinase [Polyangiaceae bacterium]|nr:serine/threonine protein kinase [Polyangiaceae bacterium]